MIIRNVDQLTPEQRNEWLFLVSQGLAQGFTSKYLQGQTLHGGDLGEVRAGQLFDEIQSELIDGLCYLAELRRRSIGNPHITVPIEAAKILIKFLDRSVIRSYTDQIEAGVIDEFIKSVKTYATTT
jgi:hypothetical protein